MWVSMVKTDLDRMSASETTKKFCIRVGEEERVTFLNLNNQPEQALKPQWNRYSSKLLTFSNSSISYLRISLKSATDYIIKKELKREFSNLGRKDRGWNHLPSSRFREACYDQHVKQNRTRK